MTGLLILVIGIIVFVLWERVKDVRLEIRHLDERIEKLETRVAVRLRSIEPVVQTAAKPPPTEQPKTPARPIVPEPSPVVHQMPPTVPASSVQPQIVASTPASEPRSDFTDWLLGTNPLVRVGIVVLLCGVAFFLSYVIDRGWLPVDVRLSMAAIGGMALTTIGWRLRESHREYGLVLQGGGIGIVYMTVFAAVNSYELIGAVPGLSYMVALVVLASALAVVQNAQSWRSSQPWQDFSRRSSSRTATTTSRSSLTTARSISASSPSRGSGNGGCSIDSALSAPSWSARCGGTGTTHRGTSRPPNRSSSDSFCFT